MNLDIHDLTLNKAEWELMTELLERSQKELLVEIRHADSGAFRSQLKLRLELVTQLLSRLQTASPV